MNDVEDYKSTICSIIQVIIESNYKFDKRNIYISKEIGELL